MLDHDHADRRQLGHLVATEASTRRALIDGELVAAAATDIGIVIDDFLDPVLGRQPATRAPVPRPAARRAPRALPAQQLLRLRTRLRTPLLARPGRILRRRLRTRPRVLPRLLLQPPQLILEPLHPSSQIENELDACLPPGVIDRLRFRAIHATKIRRRQPRTLLSEPTTERLRFARPGCGSERRTVIQSSGAGAR
jgi:hypothetical protein